MSKTRTHLILQILDHVRQFPSWVVGVCPDDETADQCCRALTAALNPHEKFGGRTAMTELGGKVSVVCVTDRFKPTEPFQVAFLGHTDKVDTDGMAAWRTAADGIWEIEQQP